MFTLDLDLGSTGRHFERWWALFFEPNYINSDYIQGE